MSAWTWTFVKAKCIPKDMIDDICKASIVNLQNIWYYKDSFAISLYKWFQMFEAEYDYFVNECKVSPDKVTKEYFINDLIQKRKDIQSTIEDYTKVIKGVISFDKALRTHKMWKKGGLGNPYCVYIKNTIWVHIPEIFRYAHYSDMTVSTGIKDIKSLIKYLRKGKQNCIYDYPNGDTTGLTKALIKRIKEYYSQFGDGNFSVHFG